MQNAKPFDNPNTATAEDLYAAKLAEAKEPVQDHENVTTPEIVACNRCHHVWCICKGDDEELDDPYTDFDNIETFTGERLVILPPDMARAHTKFENLIYGERYNEAFTLIDEIATQSGNTIALDLRDTLAAFLGAKLPNAIESIQANTKDSTEDAANSNSGMVTSESVLELTPGQQSLVSKVNALLTAGQFEKAYDLISNTLENMGGETNPDIWMNLFLIADELSDILYEHGYEGLATNLDYQTGRREATTLNLSPKEIIALSVHRNSIEPSDGLTQMLKDVMADIQSAQWRTELLSAVDPKQNVSRPDTSMFELFAENIMKAMEIHATSEGNPENTAENTPDGPTGLLAALKPPAPAPSPAP